MFVLCFVMLLCNKVELPTIGAETGGREGTCPPNNVVGGRSRECPPLYMGHF